ncbi:putative exported protein [Nitrincola lacisaponensis]|uniref:Putative exported protein n=1 Tax=Nitrincola lacisaponensis TaxID=267850 RepID=A0A063XZ94_9GAMM|nr:translocation/assembly module TamB domain-containing protein [Nitrincola lacisaponensis]KDE39423.1 putative exported protein [Nitrincola lacisaponensis]
MSWKRLLLLPVLLILLLIYLVLAMLFLPGIPALALKLGQNFLPPEVQVGSVSGALAGDLILEDVRFAQDDTAFSLERLVLEWRPSCLLRQQLCLDDIQLQGVRLSLPQTESDQTEDAADFVMPELPDIQLPVAFQLKKLRVEDIQLNLGEQQFNLAQIALSAHTDGDLWVVDSLRLQQGNTWVEWQAQLRPVGQYDLSSNLNWFIEVADIEAIINQDLDLPLTAPILGGLVLSGNADHLDVHLENQLATDLTGPISLKLRSWVQPYDEYLNLESLELQLSDTEAMISLSGQLEKWMDPELSLELEWQALQYPLLALEAPAMVQLPQGYAQLQGRLSAYLMTLDTEITGHDLPDVHLRFEGAGDLQSLAHFELNAALLGGEVALEGGVNWADQLAWNTRVWLRQLNPGQFNPELEGLVNLELTSRGSLTETGPDVRAELIALTGELRDQPLQGQGVVHYTPERIQIDSLGLSLGRNGINLQGSLRNEQLAMQFQLDAPDLSMALPDASGTLSASGEVTGAMTTPAIRADIQGTDLRYQDNRILQLGGRVQADLSGAQPSELQLELNDLLAAGQVLQRISLTGRGRPESHRLQLEVEGEPLVMDLSIEGGWQAAQSRYAGQLSRLSLSRQEIGQWLQSSATEFSVQAPAFRVGQLCLEQTEGDAVLCLTAQRNTSDRLSAEFSLSQLSLSLLDPFLQGNQIDSDLNISGNFSQQGSQQPRAEVLLTTRAGRLITPADQPDFDLDPIRLEASLASDRLTAELSALFSELEGRIQANLSVDQLSSRQRLQGDLDVLMNDLTLVSVFVPALQQVEGQLQGRLLLGGSVTQPEISGSLNLRDASMDLPAQGIRLSPLRLAIQAEGEQAERLILDGLVGSGDGEIRLQGEYNLVSLEGQLTIQGNDFEAMATEINLLISPDLLIRVDDAIRVGGSVTVPFAHITPPRQQMQNVVRASDDVVFVDDPEEMLTDRNLPLLTDLELILGDSVVVDAFGFKGRLLGRLRIQDDAVSATRASGSIQVESGDYRLFGQDMTIQRGNLIFSGGPIENPGLDLRVSRTVDTVEAGARISGTLQVPEFTLFSTPAMPDSSIMSYLILGRGPGDSSASEQSMMLQAAMALSMQGGNTITGQLREELNLDEFGFSSDDAGDSAFFIGKYLTPRLYIRYGVSLLESVEVLTLSYRLSSMWKVETQSSSVGSGADFFYTRER